MQHSKGKSLGVNAILNAFRSSLSILFPLITYPYVYRTLSAEGMGRYSYSSSIISYFALFASLGIATYAIREGAKVRDNPSKLQKVVNQLFSINVFATIVVLVVLIFLLLYTKIFSGCEDLIIVLSLTIVFTTLAADWINVIFEDYMIMTIRSLIVYLISLCLIFIFVRDSGDLIWYAVINVTTAAVTCALNRLYCRKYVRLHIVIKTDFILHFKPILFLFINSLAASIYVNLDVIMLGMMTDNYTVGVYSIAVKIYSVVKSLLVALYSASIPRLSSYIGHQDDEAYKKTITDVLAFITLFLLPASMGLILLSGSIIYIFGGNEYFSAISTLRLLSVALVGAIFGGVVSSCMNIPLGKEKINMEATLISSLLNVVLNFFVIPIYKQNGAAMTTVISEFFVLFYCVLKLRGLKRYLNIKPYIKCLAHSFIGCLSICVLYYTWKLLLNPNSIIIAIALMCSSLVIYGLELLILKNSYFIKLIEKLETKIKSSPNK